MSQTLITLTDSVKTAVKEAASEQTGISPYQLEIVQAEKHTWPNGCLGIAEPDELCSLAKVEGWRVVIENQENGHKWVYRTSLEAEEIRLEDQYIYSGNLPPEVFEAVMEEASARSHLPKNQLEIQQEERKTWPNNCLGLPDPNEGCVEMLVEGWRVVIAHEDQTWVYRTSTNAGEIRLEPSNS
ncbi:hypothetical protein NG799_17590 [Laspinema sp. D1]|uniref:Uncharacterized protein n=1 Tax=Laspinema palackyanum D2a TaxID=2953684 RepID=A0ABT2MTQ4_9CYAN|nr:hypothetical protein [Laspinema sp. D2a]